MVVLPKAWKSVPEQGEGNSGTLTVVNDPNRHTVVWLRYVIVSMARSVSQRRKRTQSGIAFQGVGNGTTWSTLGFSLNEERMVSSSSVAAVNAK